MRGRRENTQQGTLSGPGWPSLRDLRLSGGWVGRRRCRQAGSGMARSRAKARLNLSPRPAIRKMQGQPACRAGEPSGQGEEPPPEGLGVAIRSPRPIRAVQRARLWAIVWTASQAPLAAKRPEGRWFSPTPYLRSRMAFSRRGGDGQPPVRATPRPGR